MVACTWRASRAAAVTANRAEAYRLRGERKPRARIHIDQSALIIKRVVGTRQRGCSEERSLKKFIWKSFSNDSNPFMLFSLKLSAFDLPVFIPFKLTFKFCKYWLERKFRSVIFDAISDGYV